MVVLLHLIQRCTGGAGDSSSSGGGGSSIDATEADLYGAYEAVLYAIAQPFRSAQTLAIVAGGDFSVAMATPLSSLVFTGLPVGLLCDCLLTAGLQLSLQRPPRRSSSSSSGASSSLSSSSGAAFQQQQRQLLSSLQPQQPQRPPDSGRGLLSWNTARLIGFNVYACAVTQPLKVLQLRQTLSLIPSGLTTGAATPLTVMAAARAVYAESGWRGFFAGLAGRAIRHCGLVLAFLAAARFRRWLLARRLASPPPPRAIAGETARVVLPTVVYGLAGLLLHPLAVWEVASVAAAGVASPSWSWSWSYAASPAACLAAWSARAVSARTRGA